MMTVVMARNTKDRLINSRSFFLREVSSITLRDSA